MIPLNDLAAQRRRLGSELTDAIAAVLESGRFINGPEVLELEEALAKFAGRTYAVACANGTDALKIALMAMGIGPGDAVFVPSFTFFATAEVVGNVGATPVFVDIDQKSYNLDSSLLEAEIKRVIAEGQLTPRGIIGVDLFGQIANYEAMSVIAAKYKMWVMEDGAQSFGALRHGKRSCSFGRVSTTSFFPSKPLGCYGDGGMLFTDDKNLASVCRSITVHGKGKDKYDNIRYGLNSRLDTVQAAILLKKFSIFSSELDQRDRVAARYTELLYDVIPVPVVEEGTRSAWAQYCLRSPKRAELMTALKEEGIPSAIYYPSPLHKAQVFAPLGYNQLSLPVSERTTKEIFALPMHPYLDDTTIERIADIIRKSL